MSDADARVQGVDGDAASRARGVHAAECVQLVQRQILQACLAVSQDVIEMLLQDVCLCGIRG